VKGAKRITTGSTISPLDCVIRTVHPNASAPTADLGDTSSSGSRALQSTRAPPVISMTSDVSTAPAANGPLRCANMLWCAADLAGSGCRYPSFDSKTRATASAMSRP
jgi:hypothetical protein